MVQFSDLISAVNEMLNLISKDLKYSAQKYLEEHVKYERSAQEAKSRISSSGGIVELPWCGDNSCGMKLEEIVDARVLGYPLKEKEVKDPCAVCGKQQRLF